MAKKGTNDINDYVNDYEEAWDDYQQMGPLWAEMVFGDDFEAMKAIYGRNNQDDQHQSDNDRNDRGRKRR